MRETEDRAFAVLRIAFGIVWAIDAAFKWQPAFIDHLTRYLREGAAGQPHIVHAWIGFWINTVSVDPHVFAILVALAETAIAMGLLFGLLTRVALVGGILMALAIWTTAEGFGGPYQAGSTDIGAAIIYVIVFIALWLGKCWRHYSIDQRLYRRWPFIYGAW